MNAKQPVVLHWHLFKNGGTTVDFALERNFGETAAKLDDLIIDRVVDYEEVLKHLEQHPETHAVSSHTFRLPAPTDTPFLFLPIVFVRHPVDRAYSIYAYNRRQPNTRREHQRKAKELAAAEYFRWLLDESEFYRSISNFQVRQIAPVYGKPPVVAAADLEQASEHLDACVVSGIVDRMEESLVLAEMALTDHFPELDLAFVRKNVDAGRAPALTERLAQVREELGAEMYARLVQANEMDLRLYAHVNERLDARRAATPDFDVRLSDFVERCRKLPSSTIRERAARPSAEPAPNRPAPRCESTVTLRDNAFMVASPARSGSTFLVHLLRSHPDVGCHGEVLVGQQVTGIWGSYRDKARQDPAVLERLARERARNLERYLYKYILDAQGKHAIGFKLKSDELVLPEYAALKQLVQQDTDLAIIHLTRRNLLERYLSWHIVNHVTGVTLVHDESELPSIPAVQLDPAACLADFEQTRAREAFMRDLFREHPCLDVVYEDIADGSERVHHELCDFLGVPRRVLTATTRKIVRAPLDEAISNYSELRNHFADTAYASFFTAGSTRSAARADP